ncbi:MAG: radical SAM protein [Promethearchaeota archaeon]
MEPEIVELKVELLFKGIRIDGTGTEGNWEEREKADTGKERIDKLARKGGAGPAGGFFVTYRDFFQANVPLQEQMVSKSNLFMDNPRDGKFFQVYKEGRENTREKFVKLFKIPRPSFYDEEYLEKERLGIGKPVPFKSIALVHGQDCVATTVNQSCMFWRNNEQCQFCAIEGSLKDGVVPIKEPAAMVAFTARARKARRVKHFTLTSGTQDAPGGGSREYVPVVKALKDNFKYPIHVQVAPVSDFKYLDELYYAGVDNVGIHMEVFPDGLRRKICPGKGKIPISRFYKNWDYAVGLFGSNQVESYLLVGLGETYNEFKKAVEIMIDHEVIPFIVPARPIEGTEFKENLLEDQEELLKYYKYAGIRMHEQGLKPSKAVAGCVRCGACSAIGEAVKAAQHFI